MQKGRFTTPNCNGEEKVFWIKTYVDLKEYSPVNAYGNNIGDQKMLVLRDHAYYRKFE